MSSDQISSFSVVLLPAGSECVLKLFRKVHLLLVMQHFKGCYSEVISKSAKLSCLYKPIRSHSALRSVFVAQADI